jgi:hypothetical protein
VVPQVLDIWYEMLHRPKNTTPFAVTWTEAKEVLITDSNWSGFSSQMAQKFAREGAKVAVWDVNQQGLDKLSTLSLK